AQRIRALTPILILASFSQVAFAQSDAELIALLQDGSHVGIMRHSTAPGSDDPPDFRIGDCSTQRNLSEGGREQAVEIGDRLREAGIAHARILSSQWCRCVDTAELLAFGDVEELPSLNSLYSFPGQGGQMSRDTASWITAQDLSRPTILVTHQINISSLLRTGAEEGDIVVARRDAGGLTLVGRLRVY
ncbi:MAG: histidine phosphatase family protein, partial [Gammaproteobacteria bacterium]